MVAFLKSYLRDESGAAAAEYALILAVVCLAIVTAITNLGTNIGGAVQAAADKIVAP
jgi:pilus assembly protein Flp/PilA